VRKVVHFKNLTVDNKLQFESMQGQLETVKNKYNKMSKAIDRFEQKITETKDEFYDIKIEQQKKRQSLNVKTGY